MEIYGNTRYVDLSKQKEPWYQLSVTNQWDWVTKSICFQTYGTTTIGFHLKINTPVDDRSYKSETVTEITDEMKECLLKDGYAF